MNERVIEQSASLLAGAHAALRLSYVFIGFIWMFLRRAPDFSTAIISGSKIDRQRLLGEIVASTAELLGPVFIKATQMISYRSDLLPSAFLSPLSRLQDNVEPEPFSVVRSTLERSYGQPLYTVFRRFEPIAIGSGSIACVFLAETNEGNQVAVKVTRSNIRLRISHDLKSLRTLVSFLSGLQFVRGIPIIDIYTHIADMIYSQADMEIEAAYLNEISRKQVRSTRVKVPQAIHSLVRSDILVMEYIDDSVPISHHSISAVNYKNASREVLRTLYDMIFESGLVHCDMHPGNILVSVGGTVALVDAGLVSHLSETDRRCFRDFFLSLVFGESIGCADSIIRASGYKADKLNRKEFRKDVSDLINMHHAKSAGDFLVAEFVHQVFMIQRRHKLYGSPGFVSAIWALVMFEGLVRYRFPELDFQQEAKSYITGSIVDMIRRGGDRH